MEKCWCEEVYNIWCSIIKVILNIMLDFLNEYKKGNFEFDRTNSLRKVCNAPTGCCGVYIVYACYENGKEEIVYIGSSGRMNEGKVLPRIGGLYRRIVGKQDGVPRGKLWPERMQSLSVEKIKVYWYDTGEKDNPLFVEYCLILKFIIEYKRLPLWNNELKISMELKEDLNKFMMDKCVRFD